MYTMPGITDFYVLNLEKRVAANNRNKREIFRKKWYRIENKVP